MPMDINQAPIFKQVGVSINKRGEGTIAILVKHIIVFGQFALKLLAHKESNLLQVRRMQRLAFRGGDDRQQNVASVHAVSPQSPTTIIPYRILLSALAVNGASDSLSTARTRQQTERVWIDSLAGVAAAIRQFGTRRGISYCIAFVAQFLASGAVAVNECTSSTCNTADDDADALPGKSQRNDIGAEGD